MASEPRRISVWLAARPVLRSLAEAALVALLAVGVAIVSIEAWRSSLSIPYLYASDGQWELMRVKAVVEHGSFYTNPNIGAPFGFQLFDFATGANLVMLLLNAVALFSNDPAVVMNVFFLLTFPLAAVTAWWVMRELGASNAAATVCAVLFAILPYHFWRGEYNLHLSAYFAVPFVAYLVIGVLQGGALFVGSASNVGSRLRLLTRRRNLAILAMCILIGSSGAYYVAFACALLALASLVVLATPGRRRSGFAGLALVCLILGVFTINLVPALSYRYTHGENEAVGKRAPAESEELALSFSQLVLPSESHRLEFLADRKERYLNETNFPLEADSAALGLIGTVGLFWLLLAVAASALGRASWALPVERQAGIGVLLAFLLSTVGGISTLIAFWVTSQFRAWNRMSVVIAMFSLLAAALLLDRLLRRLRVLRHGSLLVIGLSTAILAVGFYDQTPEQFKFPVFIAGQSDARAYKRDERFVERLEAAYPRDTAVFQLPYQEFPEGPPRRRMIGYDPLRGYLHSEELRWSYGAMKGRSADLGACLQGLPPTTLIPALRAFGFGAVWVDRFGYSAREYARLEEDLRILTKADPMASEDRRFVVFDLAGVAAGGPSIAAALPSSGDELIDCAPIRRALHRR